MIVIMIHNLYINRILFKSFVDFVHERKSLIYWCSRNILAKEKTNNSITVWDFINWGRNKKGDSVIRWNNIDRPKIAKLRFALKLVICCLLCERYLFNLLCFAYVVVKSWIGCYVIINTSRDVKFKLYYLLILKLLNNYNVVISILFFW